MDKGFKIRMLREQKGIAQKTVALKLRISQSAYSKMEACEERISIENCKKIADAIGVSISDILGFEDKYQFVNKETIILNEQLKNKITSLEDELSALKADNRMLIRLLDSMNLTRPT